MRVNKEDVEKRKAEEAMLLEEIKGRTKELIASMGLTVRGFSVRINEPQSSFDKMMKDKQKMNVKTICKVVSKITDVSARWYMTGEGEMWEKDNIADPMADLKLQTKDTEINTLSRRILRMQEEINALNDQVEMYKKQIECYESKVG